MRSRGVAWVLASALGDGDCWCSSENRAAEDSRTIGQRVNGIDPSNLDSQPERFGGDMQQLRGIAQLSRGSIPSSAGLKTGTWWCERSDVTRSRTNDFRIRF